MSGEETGKETKSKVNEDSVISVTVKNPSETSPGDYEIRVPSNFTIQDVKNLLHLDYKGNPDPSRQKIIVAGKVLSNNLTLNDIFKQKSPDDPRIVHLVVSSIPTSRPSFRSSSKSSSQQSSSSRSASLSQTSSTRVSDDAFEHIPPFPLPSNTPVVSDAHLNNLPSLTNSNPSQSSSSQSSSSQYSSSNQVFLNSLSNERSALHSLRSFSAAGIAGTAASSSSDLSHIWGDPDSYLEDEPALYASTNSLGTQTPPPEPLPQPPFPGFHPNANAPFPGPYGGLPVGFPFPPYFPPAYLGGGFPPPNLQTNTQGGSEGGSNARTNAAAPMPPPLPFGMMPFQYPFPFPFIPGMAGFPPAGGNPPFPWGMYYPPPHFQPQPQPHPPNQSQNQGQGQVQGHVPVQQAQFNAMFNVQQGVPRPVNAGPRRQGRVILALRLDLLLIFKLIVLVFFFNQNGSFQNTFLMSLCAAAYYLYQTGALAPLQRWLSQFTNQALGVRLPQAPNQPQQNEPVQQQPPQPQPQPQQQQQQQQEGNENREGDAQNRAGQEHQEPQAQARDQVQNPPQPRRRGFLREIQMFFAGFLFSLLPGFQGNAAPMEDLNNPNHQD